ncbi:MAG TPA: hypothetical protein VGP47_09795 [Parachlamydiaceae bacterium]|nr:hypothetical protein [Parachlamydiaceae bacterium]
MSTFRLCLLVVTKKPLSVRLISCMGSAEPILVANSGFLKSDLYSLKVAYSGGSAAFNEIANVEKPMIAPKQHNGKEIFMDSSSVKNLQYNNCNIKSRLHFIGWSVFLKCMWLDSALLDVDPATSRISIGSAKIFNAEGAEGAEDAENKKTR